MIMSILHSTSISPHSIGTGEIDLASQAGMNTTDKAEHLLILQNVGAVNLYVGNSGSVTYGYELVAGENLQIRVPAGDRLMGCTSSGTASIRVVVVRG